MAVLSFLSRCCRDVSHKETAGRWPWQTSVKRLNSTLKIAGFPVILYRKSILLNTLN